MISEGGRSEAGRRCLVSVSSFCRLWGAGLWPLDWYHLLMAWLDTWIMGRRGPGKAGGGAGSWEWLLCMGKAVLVAFYVMSRNWIGFKCCPESYSCLPMQMGSLYCLVDGKNIITSWLLGLSGFPVQDGEGQGCVSHFHFVSFNLYQ